MREKREGIIRSYRRLLLFSAVDSVVAEGLATIDLNQGKVLLEGRSEGLQVKRPVTFREVSQDEVLAALGDGEEDSVLRACVAALRVYPRPSYVIGGSPTNALRMALEVKYRQAAS